MIGIVEKEEKRKGEIAKGVEKKKMIIIITGAIVAVAVCVMFFLFSKERVALPIDLETTSLDGVAGETEANGLLELIGVADTEEIADKLAEDYGIELKSYEYGIAVFVTEKSYQEITEIGKAKGLPELSPNNKLKAN